VLLTNRIASLVELFRNEALPFSAKCRVCLLEIRRRLPVSEREFNVDLRKGMIFVNPSHAADYAAFHEIFVQHQYQTDYKGTVVIDVGAHKGYYAAYALMRGADAVMAYEPEDANYRVLEKTAVSFSRGGVKLMPERIAVAAEDGEIELFVTNQSWSHSVFRRGDRDIVTSQRVRASSFGGILNQARGMAGRRKLVVKMNIEGAEGDIIRRTPTSSLSEIDVMFLETHAFGGYDVRDLIARLEKSGLRVQPCNKRDCFVLTRN
jgi:FkbM family methyltransferase